MMKKIMKTTGQLAQAHSVSLSLTGFHNCRILIVVLYIIIFDKHFLQAYDWSIIDIHEVQVEMPINSYTIKTAIFYLLAYRSNELHFVKVTDNDPRDLSGVVYEYRDAANALWQALGEAEVNVDELEKKPKLQFNPHAVWTTDDDLDKHKEEARVWATKMFTLIKNLALQKYKLSSFWERGQNRGQNLFLPVAPIKGFGEAEYTCNICDCILDRLNEGTFYDNCF